MIDDRIAERRREVREGRRRTRLRRTVTIALLLVLVVALVLIERSSLVGLAEIRVSGVERLSGEQVRDAAAIPLGTSTLRLGLDEAEDRVRRLPLVRTVTARRVDPLTVSFEVVERQPVLVARGPDGEVLVDRDGVIIADGALEGLPVIELASEPPGPGAPVAQVPSLANAHAVWRGLSGPLRAQIERYRAPDPADLDLVTADGLTIRFGRAERIAEKVRAIGVVLEDVGETPIAAVDVRAPRAPVVVPAD